jgi:hypothetical protein
VKAGAMERATSEPSTDYDTTESDRRQRIVEAWCDADTVLVVAVLAFDGSIADPDLKKTPRIVQRPKAVRYGDRLFVANILESALDYPMGKRHNRHAMQLTIIDTADVLDAPTPDGTPR